jgi:hypothetical protein
MRLLAALFCLLFSCCALAAGPIGVFTEADGEVRIVRGQNYFAATPAVDVLADDVIETGSNASAQIELEDGSMFKLGPSTRLALADYTLANKNVVSATVDVLSGWVRFAVSKLQGSARYQIRTPTITLGIRGTGGAIEASAEQGGLDLEEGLVDVTSVDDAPNAAPTRVAAGEYVEHHRGRALQKMRGAPAAFRGRVPPAVRAKLMRRALLMKKRGVPPRMIRALTREEAKHMMERRQLMQQRMRQMHKRAVRKQRDEQ